MIHVSKQLDGAKLRKLQKPGFVEETVLVVDMGDGREVVCAFHVRQDGTHTHPPQGPRAAELDEVAEVADALADRVRTK